MMEYRANQKIDKMIEGLGGLTPTTEDEEDPRDRMRTTLRQLLPDDIRTIYNPFCGDGWLLKGLNKDILKFGLDTNEAALREAEKSLKNFRGMVGDALTTRMANEQPYIIAVPPFTGSWDREAKESEELFRDWPCKPAKSRATYAYVAHILDTLTEDGTAVAVLPAAAMWRVHDDRLFRKYLVLRGSIERIVDLDEGILRPKAVIWAVAVVLKKRRTDKGIIMQAQDKQRRVELEEIYQEQFDLDPMIYLDVQYAKENQKS